MSQAAAYFDLIARTDSMKRAVKDIEVYAKDAKTRVEAIKIKSPQLDTNGFKRQLDQMVSDVERAAKQMSDKLLDDRINERANRVTRELSRARARQNADAQAAAAAIPGQVAASVGFNPDADARFRFSQTAGGRMLGLGGGAAGGVSGGGLLDAFLRVGTVLKVAEASIKVVNAYTALWAGNAQVAAGNFDKGLANLSKFASTAQSIPVVGQLLQAIGGDFAGDISKRREEVLAANDKMRDRITDRRKRDISVGNELGGLRVAALGPGATRDRAAAQQDFDAAMGGIGERLRSNEISAEQANQLRDAQRRALARRQIEINQAEEARGDSVRAKYAQGENIELRMAGGGREASRRDLLLQIQMEQKAADRALGSRDEGQAKLGAARLAEYDLQETRRVASMKADTVAAIQENSLRAAGRAYEADRAAFEASWDAKIRKIKEGGDAVELQLAEQQRASEREARDANVRREREDLIAQAATIRLQTAGKGRTAEINNLVRDTMKAIDNAAPENREAVADVGRARLEAIDKQLRIEQANTRAEVYTAGSFRSFSNGIDTGRESLDVLRNRIATSLESIDSKVGGASTPVAG